MRWCTVGSIVSYGCPDKSQKILQKSERPEKMSIPNDSNVWPEGATTIARILYNYTHALIPRSCLFSVIIV